MRSPRARKVAAWSELLIQAAFVSTPAGGPSVDEPHEELEPELLPDSVLHAGHDSRALSEPQVRAIDGYLAVRYLDGPERYNYVGRDPDFIMAKLRAAKEAGEELYEYWACPGFSDSELRRIPCRLVSAVRVQHLEADLDAIYEDPSRWVLG